MPTKPKQTKPKASKILPQSPLVRTWQSLNKNKYAPLIGGLIIAFIIFLAIKSIMIINQRLNLNWASQRLDYVQAQIERDPAFTEIKRGKVCFHANAESDFDPGPLRCQVYLSGVIVSDNQENLLTKSGEIYTPLGAEDAFGNIIKSASDNNGSFDVQDKGLNCDIAYTKASDNNPSSVVKRKFAIACDALSSWRFYPVNEHLILTQ